MKKTLSILLVILLISTFAHAEMMKLTPAVQAVSAIREYIKLDHYHIAIRYNENYKDEAEFFYEYVKDQYKDVTFYYENISGIENINIIFSYGLEGEDLSTLGSIMCMMNTLVVSYRLDNTYNGYVPIAFDSAKIDDGIDVVFDLQYIEGCKFTLKENLELIDRVEILE